LVLEYCKSISCLPKELQLHSVYWIVEGGGWGGREGGEILCRKEKRTMFTLKKYRQKKVHVICPV
jgi:hypothetical protein